MDVCSHAACSLERGGTVVAKSRGCGGDRVVRIEALTPFYYNYLRQASEGLFLHSLCASPGSFNAECFEVVFFLCPQLLLLCSKDLLPWQPTLFCCWLKEQESCCSPVAVFGDELSQYHSANAWLSDTNNCFLFCEHICEYCISVYFST